VSCPWSAVAKVDPLDTGFGAQMQKVCSRTGLASIQLHVGG
jgi:hypothetical protein